MIEDNMEGYRKSKLAMGAVHVPPWHPAQATEER